MKLLRLVGKNALIDLDKVVSIDWSQVDESDYLINYYFDGQYFRAETFCNPKDAIKRVEYIVSLLDGRKLSDIL